ncbi:MAG: hypothetical protein ACLGJB_09305, partial [Blastocatellia bacterium]
SVYRGYWDSPRANVSRDGRYAVYTSNWGSADRTDVFICRIPPASGPEAQPAAPGITAPSGVARESALAVAGGGARQNVMWVDILRAAAAANTLQKIGGRDDAPDAGARSRQSIAAGDAWVEFTAAETNKTRYCGLAAEGSAGTDFAGIDFAIKLTASGSAEVRESGAYAAETTYQSGDSFRIAVEAGHVNYYKNGSLFYTSLNAPTYPLIIKASLINLNASISNAIVSAPPGARPSK